VAAEEADLLLGVIEERVARRRTGADWQLARLARHEERLTRPDALRAMLADYVAAQASGAAVHSWEP
jgi:hypothetical protein